MRPQLLAFALALTGSSALAGRRADPLAEPHRTAATAPGDAAVVIGLEDYAFVPDVDFAGRDAQAVRDWLVYTRGVPVERVLLRTSGSAEQLLAAVETAAGQVQAGGILWVYFAGHGMASPDGGARLLLGDDARPDYETIARRAVLVDEVVARAQAAGAVPVLLVDACYTGRGRGGEALIEGRPLVPVSTRQPDRPGLVWSGASADQAALPLRGEEHGAFTFALVGALRGWADGELDGQRDGRVTLAEAQAFVGRALPVLQEQAQVPELVRGEGLPDLVLAEGVGELGPDELQPRRESPAAAAVVARPERSSAPARWRVGLGLALGIGDTGRTLVEAVELQASPSEELGRYWSVGPDQGAAPGGFLEAALRLHGRAWLGLGLGVVSSHRGGSVSWVVYDEADDGSSGRSTLGSREAAPLGLLSAELGAVETDRVDLRVRLGGGALLAPGFHVGAESDGEATFEGADPLLVGLGALGASGGVRVGPGLHLVLGVDGLLHGQRASERDDLSGWYAEDLDDTGRSVGYLLLARVGPAWTF